MPNFTTPLAEKNRENFHFLHIAALKTRNFSEPIFGKGMRRSTFQVKKGFLSEKGGGNSVTGASGGFGKGFYRKGNSVKRSGRFSEPPDSEN